MGKIRAVDDDAEHEPVGFSALGFAGEEELDAYLQEGIDDIDAGRTVDHGVIKADIAAMRAELRGR